MEWFIADLIPSVANCQDGYNSYYKVFEKKRYLSYKNDKRKGE